MLRAQRAQGLVEYGLILVLVSIAAIVIMQVMGNSVISLYSQANSAFPGA
jgi:Flp pilus assembly pilin Flp